MSTCPQCGLEMEGDLYCPHCGYQPYEIIKLNDVTERRVSVINITLIFFLMIIVVFSIIYKTIIFIIPIVVILIYMLTSGGKYDKYTRTNF